MGHRAALSIVIAIFAAAASAQQAPTAFPLAAPAGKDSNARQVAPPGAVNQGPFDDARWKYGPGFNAPAGA